MTLQQRGQPLLGREGSGSQERFLTRHNNFVWPQSILGLLDRGDSAGEEQVDHLDRIQDDDGNGREKALK